MDYPMTSIHPDAKIADNVKIDPFTTIHENVEIGEGTWIGSNVSIMEGARVGKNCRIFPGAVISAIPQDLKFDGENSLAIVGDGTTIREFVTLNRGTKAHGSTEIGKNCLIMAYVHIAHDCIVGDRCILVNNATLGGHVEIGDWAIVSAMTAVHQFVRIGQHVMVSGGSMVRKDVPPYITAGRDPLAFVGLNSIGLRRRQFSSEQINQIQKIYKILYMEGKNTSQAIDIIQNEIPKTEERDEILTFLKKATRGIIRGNSGSA